MPHFSIGAAWVAVGCHFRRAAGGGGGPDFLCAPHFSIGFPLYATFFYRSRVGGRGMSFSAGLKLLSSKAIQLCGLRVVRAESRHSAPTPTP